LGKLTCNFGCILSHSTFTPSIDQANSKANPPIGNA